MVAGNKICWLLSKSMGEKMYHLSTKVSGRHTLMWTVKNSVENSRIIRAGDLLSPIDGLAFTSNVLSLYNKEFGTKMIENLGNSIAYNAKKILDPIATKIANGEFIDLDKYKKAAQGLGRNTKAIKEIFLDKGMSSEDSIRDALVYYAATTIEGYMKGYGDMNKTISQYQGMVESGLDPYPYYFSTLSSEIYVGMVSNMQNMLDSVNDLNNFITHSSQQDSLRLLENFNHEPLIGISDLSDANLDKSMELFAKIYSPNGKDVGLSPLQYKKLIRQMNGNYDPISLLAGQKTSKAFNIIVKTSADARRFSTGVLNFPMTIALTGGSFADYTMKAVGAFSSGLYDVGKLEDVRGILGYDRANVFGMSTRADINDIISSGVGTGDLSYLNRISKWINGFTKKQLEEFGANNDIAAMVGESAGESLKGLHNMVDSLFKIIAQNTAIGQALRRMQYLDEKAFIQHYKSTPNKEALVQELRRLTDEYMQIGVGFFGPATWNVSTFNDTPFIKHLMYLGSWGLNMMQNFFNLTAGRPIGLLIDGITGFMGGVPGAFKKSINAIGDHYANDPGVNLLFKTLYYTAFIGHKIQMTMDNDDENKTNVEKASEAFGTFGRWMNGYLQGMESNREGRLGLSVVDMFNSPFMEGHKVTGMIAGMFKSMSRDFLSVHRGSAMLANSLAAMGEGAFDEGGFSMQMFKDFSEEWMKQSQGMNRYFINETMSSLDSKNIPFSNFDNRSMILGKHLNGIAEVEQAIRDVSDAKKLEENAGNWMFQQIMYNSSMAKYFKSLDDRYNPKATEEGVTSIFDKFSELGVLSDAGLLPLEIPGDETRTKEWHSEVNRVIKHLGIYGGAKDKTLTDIFLEAGIRDPDNFEETYTYNTLNTIADLLLKSELSDKELFKLERLRDSDVKGKSDTLADELMMRYVMKNDGSDGGILLNRLAYKYRNKLEQDYAKDKYVSSKELPQSSKDAINKQITERFGKYIQMVDLNVYTSLMKSYVEKNPAFDDLKGFYDNGSMKGDVQNAYKAILFTMASVTNGENVESISQIKNIMSSLYNIKDEGFKMHIVAQAYDLLEQGQGIDIDSKTQIEARMFKEISPLIRKAVNSEAYLEEHKDIIGKMLEMQHGTKANIQQMMDNEYESQRGF